MLPKPSIFVHFPKCIYMTHLCRARPSFNPKMLCEYRPWTAWVKCTIYNNNHFRLKLWKKKKLKYNYRNDQVCFTAIVSSPYLPQLKQPIFMKNEKHWQLSYPFEIPLVLHEKTNPTASITLPTYKQASTVSFQNKKASLKGLFSRKKMCFCGFIYLGR